MLVASSPASPSITFRAHAEAWLGRIAATRKPATCALYAAAVHGDLAELFGDLDLAQLTRGTIRRGLDVIAARGLSPSSMIRLRAVVVQILDDALERDLVATNVARDIRPMRHAPTRPLVVPSERDLERIREVLPRVVSPDRQMLFRILEATALRVGEAQTLKPSAYDPRTRRLRVERTADRTRRAPGDKTGAPKSNAGRRWVDVPDSLAADLPGFLAGRAESAWMFPGRSGARPITYPPIRDDMRAIAKAAGVPGMTAHGFRHARLSLWIAAGADLEWCRRQAGHHSIAFLIRTYGHLMPMRRQRVLSDLPRDARADDAET